MSKLTPEQVVGVKKERGVRHIDVRTPEEFEEGHPANSVNIAWMVDGPHGLCRNPAFMGAIRKQFPDTDEEVVLSCKSGARSAQACAYLQEAGYTKLLDMEGGWLKYAANADLERE